MKYSQSRGVLEVGTLKAQGYAGRGTGKNNPLAQSIRALGPLPRGWYTVDLTPFDHPRCGPHCLRLTPDKENEMFGRDGFLIHGDSIDRPGDASHGCIVVPRFVREAVVSGGHSRLEVVE